MQDHLIHFYNNNTNLLAVLGRRDGVGAALAVVLGYIFTLPERGAPVLQNMPNAESIAVKSALFAELRAVRTQRLVVHLRIVNVFSFIHPRAETL